MFAQGGLEFKRRFTSCEVAVRLLELALGGKGEVLQATCAMALSHLLLFVMTPSAVPLSATLNGEASSVLSTTSGRKGATTAASPNHPDPFLPPTAVSAAKFMVRVLEKGGLAGIVEVLRDGQPRLQQAFLNIVNLVFAAPLCVDELAPTTPGRGHKAAEDAGAVVQGVNVALRLTRSFFLKAASTIPTVVKLAEQGASSAVRGKALLTAQLLCRQAPQSLITLGERRMPQLLARVLEPVVAQLHAAQQHGEAEPAELSYYVRTALSMVGYVKEVCEEAAAAIALQLQAVATDVSSGAGDAGDGHAHRTPEPSPDKHGLRRKTPASAVPLKHTPGASATSKPQFDATKLTAAAEMLLAAVTISSQPTLRRLVLTCDGQIATHLANALRQLPKARSAAALFTTHLEELERALGLAEQACLVALETISQVA